jgi:hypothetical protein
MKPTTLDLKVPRGWQMCSTRELEMIAEEIMRAQMMASLSRFHPFDWIEIKTRLFFRFAGVEVLGSAPSGSDLDIASQRDALSGSDPSNTSAHLSAPSLGSGPDRASASDAQSAPDPYTFLCRKGDVEFPLETWQVHSFLEQLKWLDATDAKGRPLPMPKLMWPYPKRIRRWWPLWRREYYAPGELMDGMTWQTYRWINDWMEAYTNTANALVDARQKKGDIASLVRQERDIRLTVLSLMFGCPKWRVRLARISEVEWQVIMFWWSSMMQYLKEQYPKCFKSSAKPSRSQRQTLPIELYTRSMATLQKYLGGLTEDEINAQTAHAILRHLNDMAVEAEEMEKIRRKHK